jgi:hypothetical protein
LPPALIRWRNSAARRYSLLLLLLPLHAAALISGSAQMSVCFIAAAAAAFASIQRCFLHRGSKLSHIIWLLVAGQLPLRESLTTDYIKEKSSCLSAATSRREYERAVQQAHMARASSTPHHSNLAPATGSVSYGGGVTNSSRCRGNDSKLREVIEVAREVSKSGSELGMSESPWLRAVARRQYL